VFFRYILVTFILMLSCLQSVEKHKKIPISEDELIIRAIFYDEYEIYENSYLVYKKLFDETHEEAYLFKEVRASLLSQKNMLESIHRLKEWERSGVNMIAVKRLLIPLYLIVRQVKNAKREAKALLSLSKEAVDLDLSSSAFLYAGEFEYALELLNKAYALGPTESVLLRIVEVLDEFKNERPKAIQLLETHHRMNHVSPNVYMKLLLLYKKEQNIDGILETYKVMYTADRQDDYLDKIIDAYVYKRDIKGVIKFLEEDKSKLKILYELYKIQKDFSKAISLIDTLYDSDKDSKWIAEKAVLIFEKAKDKNDKNMISEVLRYLEKAIALGNNDSIYLNYYGYTLIDKEVDVKKGMKVIQDALVQQPNNTYYLDSLAWGYYKENNCAKAYHLMKRVVEEEGLEEEEISTHWNAIRRCK